MFLNDLSAIAGALRGIKIFDSTSVELQFISTYIYRKGTRVIVPVVFREKNSGTRVHVM